MRCEIMMQNYFLIFCDASWQTCALILTVCLKCSQCDNDISARRALKYHSNSDRHLLITVCYQSGPVINAPTVYRSVISQTIINVTDVTLVYYNV